MDNNVVKGIAAINPPKDGEGLDISVTRATIIAVSTIFTINIIVICLFA